MLNSIIDILNLIFHFLDYPNEKNNPQRSIPNGMNRMHRNKNISRIRLPFNGTPKNSFGEILIFLVGLNGAGNNQVVTVVCTSQYFSHEFQNSVKVDR